MLRHRVHHFEALRPYRWRLERLAQLTKPTYHPEHRAIVAALDALDRAAALILTPEEFDRFREPWFPQDQT